jgi:hypothetical protein
MHQNFPPPLRRVRASAFTGLFAILSVALIEAASIWPVSAASVTVRTTTTTTITRSYSWGGVTSGYIGGGSFQCGPGSGFCPGENTCTPLGAICCGNGRYCNPGQVCSNNGNSCVDPNDQARQQQCNQLVNELNHQIGQNFYDEMHNEATGCNDWAQMIGHAEGVLTLTRNLEAMCRGRYTTQCGSSCSLKRIADLRRSAATCEANLRGEQEFQARAINDQQKSAARDELWRQNEVQSGRQNAPPPLPPDIRRSARVAPAAGSTQCDDVGPGMLLVDPDATIIGSGNCGGTKGKPNRQMLRLQLRAQVKYRDQPDILAKVNNLIALATDPNTPLPDKTQAVSDLGKLLPDHDKDRPAGPNKGPVGGGDPPPPLYPPYCEPANSYPKTCWQYNPTSPGAGCKKTKVDMVDGVSRVLPRPDNTYADNQINFFVFDQPCPPAAEALYWAERKDAEAAAKASQAQPNP